MMITAILFMNSYDSYDSHDRYSYKSCDSHTRIFMILTNTSKKQT